MTLGLTGKREAHGLEERVCGQGYETGATGFLQNLGSNV